MSNPIVIKPCRTRSCCPVVLIDKDTAIIRDDYGGEVRMTIQQLKEIVECQQVRDRLNPVS